MATLIGSLIRAAARKSDEALNILSFSTHERYQTGLAKTGHNFYLLHGPGIKTWNNTYAPLPDNTYILNGEIPVDLDLDLVVSQNKWGQYPAAYHFASKYHLPLITLEHTLPTNQQMVQQLETYKNMVGNINVFISDYSVKAWQWEDVHNVEVIHHGVDTELFKPDNNSNKELHVLSVVNDFANRDEPCGFTLWKNVVSGLPYKLLGDNPGISKGIGPEELTKAYQTCRVFLNTSLISPVPTVLLEAMSCAAPVVSTNNCMIPEIIEHGVNGLLANTESEMRDYVELLLENEEYGRSLGEAARQTILDKFSLDNFVNKWGALFNKAKDIVYTGDFNETKFAI